MEDVEDVMNHRNLDEMLDIDDLYITGAVILMEYQDLAKIMIFHFARLNNRRAC